MSTDLKIVKRCITNSVNDNEWIEWKFGTIAEVDAWIEKEKEEEDTWNYRTAGAVSRRSYDFTEIDPDSFLDTDISELEGLSLRNLFLLYSKVVAIL